jgi:hypothetical protein
MTDPTTRARHTRQQRLILSEPDTGWSREDYEHELATYVAERGRAPQTATMHTETAAALGLREAFVTPAAGDQPLLITSADYPPQTITLYY